MLTALVFVSALLFAQDRLEHEVRLRPEAGEPCASTLTIEWRGTMEFANPPLSPPKRYRQLLVFRLEGLAPDKSGNRAIKLWFKRLLVDNDGEMSVDTDRPGKSIPQEGNPVRHMIGLSVILKVKADGTIAGMSGLDELKREFIERTSFSEEEIEKLGDGPQQLMSILTAQIPQVLGYSSPEPVSVGESWSRSFAVGWQEHT